MAEAVRHGSAVPHLLGEENSWQGGRWKATREEAKEVKKCKKRRESSWGTVCLKMAKERPAAMVAGVWP